MAQIVFTDAHFEINSVDLSDHVRQITLTYTADEVDGTAMGDTTHKRLGSTLKDWSMDVELYSDEAASKTSATIFSLLGTTTTVLLRATSSSVSATNPNYTGTGFVASFQPLGGSVGDASMSPCRVLAAGNLSRATA